MKNGFIYPIFDVTIRCLRYISLVELFKFLAIKGFTGSTDNEIKYRSRVAIDIFQVFKWAFVGTLFLFGSTTDFSKYTTYYLIWVNLYSYFLFHVWGSSYRQSGDRAYIRSRFLNSILAISFFLFCYAYLYMHHFNSEIIWPENQVDFINSIYLSVANAFTLTYGGFVPKTQTVRILFMTELLNTFVFFTIILSNSIPNPVEEQ